MRKIVLIHILLLCFSLESNAQTLLKHIESEIQTMIYNDSKSWKASEYVYGTVAINDATDGRQKLIVKGTFVANVTQWPVRGKRTISYTAEVKKVLDDVVIKKIYWTQPITNLNWCIGDCE